MEILCLLMAYAACCLAPLRGDQGEGGPQSAVRTATRACGVAFTPSQPCVCVTERPYGPQRGAAGRLEETAEG